MSTPSGGDQFWNRASGSGLTDLIDRNREVDR